MSEPKLRFGVFAQLALLMGGLAAGSTTIALLIQDRTLSSDLREAATDRLTRAASAADRLMSEHLADVADRYTAISTTPEFRANLEAGDRSTLSYHAQRLADRQGATAVAFQSPEGRLVAVAGDESMAHRTAEQAEVHTPAFVVASSRLLAVAAIPLFTGDDLVGHLLAAEPVGPDVLAAWSEVLGVHVTVGDPGPPPADALVAVARAFPEASIQVTTTYGPEQRAISRSRRNLILSGLAAVLIAVLASMILAHSFARPIKEMKRAAEGVDRESLDAHFDVQRHDELGDLGRAFGDMLNRLRESETRLTRAHRLARFSNWWFDLETNTVEAGHDFRRLFALESESVIAVDDIIRKIHPDDHPKLIDGLDRVRAPNGAFRTDVRVPLGRGRDRILHLRGQRRPSDDDRARVEASAQDVTERWHSARQIKYLSLHDSVTGLGNRQYLFERLGVQLKQAAHDKSTVALFLIGVDGFGSVEGAFGHRVGDELLCEVARRLIETLSLPRQHDRGTRHDSGAHSAVRFGNAEFAAVDMVLTREEAASLAESLIQSIEAVYVIEDHEISVGASVGISLFPDDATTVDALVRHGKAALQTGRSIPDPYHFYDESLHERESRRLQVASLLRRAIERDELEVHYQPRVRTESGELVAIEALLRWDNDQLGSIPPGEFVPIAEDVGLVQDLGDWCLRAAVRDLLRWQAMGVTDLRISVNVSPQQLLPAFVDRILHITGDVDPRSIEFEVTESAVMRDPDEALGLLTQLADYGFRIALDDFGTGYSSMSHVRRLPLDAVKIDRSFIKDLATHEEARSITSAVIMMCRAMNLESVAEGVETEPQRKRLIELGCDEVQGFLFARPMPAAELEALLEQQGLTSAPTTAV